MWKQYTTYYISPATFVVGRNEQGRPLGGMAGVKQGVWRKDRRRKKGGEKEEEL